jgi:hypothetical protein
MPGSKPGSLMTSISAVHRPLRAIAAARWGSKPARRSTLSVVSVAISAASLFSFSLESSRADADGCSRSTRRSDSRSPRSCCGQSAASSGRLGPAQPACRSPHRHPDAALPAGIASQRGQFELLLLTPIVAVIAATKDANHRPRRACDVR